MAETNSNYEGKDSADLNPNRPKKTILQILLEEQEKATAKDGVPDRYYAKYIKMAKQGINPIHKMVEEARAFGIVSLSIDAIIQKAKEKGDWWEDYSVVKNVMQRIRDIYNQKSAQEQSADIAAVTEEHFDYKRDADLIAHALFIDPKVREEFKGKIEHLYRAVLRYGREKKRGERELGYREDREHKRHERGEVFTKSLETLISALPADVFSKDDEHYTGLRKLIRKKANRDAIVHFKKSVESGLKFLEDKIATAKNTSIKFVYNDVLQKYRAYASFEFQNVNNEFRNPTNPDEKGTLPSLHQRITVYEALERQRYGILHGCGTGKTAIGAMLYPLVVQKKKQEGKKVHNRVVIVGTIPCLKTWRRGFEGNDAERYLSSKKKIAVVNGHSRNQKLYEQLKSSEVVFANYQQLSAKFEANGQTKPVYEVLEELGYDLLIFDEVHNIKNRRNFTKGGKESHSAAARHLAMKDPEAYFSLLTATPMPDSLDDYAVIYNLLRPDMCPDPENFVKTIKRVGYDPHTLSTFIDENTSRVTAKEVNDLEEIDEESIYDDIQITGAQRKIHDYLLSHRPLGWLMETRKALLDPRLVDPKILRNTGLLGSITADDSAKYRKLEQLITSENGPLKKNEKFVVFSSTLKEGITRTAQNIANDYVKLGLNDECASLGLETSLQTILDGIVKKHGKDKYIEIIDGNVTMFEREKAVSRFRADPNCVGVLCTTETGGESVDFSNANHGYFLDEDYSPSTNEQAIARLWRRGQTRPVEIKFLRGTDTMDQSISDYVDRKRLTIQIALDGHPLTPAEIALLTESRDNAHLTDLILRRFGGIATDISAYKSFSIDDVVVKTSARSAGKNSSNGSNGSAETTRAQAIGLRIGSDPKCWFDPEFAKTYFDALPELAPYIIHRMKILDLISRAKEGEIVFPQRILAPGSGPGILWSAYQSLESAVTAAGLQMPDVHDLDFSAEMLKRGSPAKKIVADMRRIPIRAGEYDCVDNASISLLKNPQEVLESLLESNRVLKQGGLLELSVKKLYFKDQFYDALRQLGFEVLTKPHTYFTLSRQARSRLAEEHGVGFAEAVKAKLDKSHFILARKVSEPKPVENTADLWFIADNGTEYERFARKEEPVIEIGSAQPPKKGGKSRAKNAFKAPTKVAETHNIHRPYIVNKDGTVDMI